MRGLVVLAALISLGCTPHSKAPAATQVTEAQVPSPSAASPAPLASSKLTEGSPESVRRAQQAPKITYAMAVTSVEPNATRAGIEMLEQGGNAVDAAVATALVLAVTHPSAGNLGGGGFALVRAPGKPSTAIDFRETAPRSLTQARFEQMIREGARGPAAVGVPGSVAGLFLLHQKHGKKEWRELVEPALRLATHGYPLGSRAARVLKGHWALISGDPGIQKVFGRGRAPAAVGTVIRQPDLARTLRLIAEQGRDGFYAGTVAEALAAASGGRLTVAEIGGYRARERSPMSFTHRGFLVETMPPPSAGGATLALILRYLEQNSVADPWSTEGLHVFAEASRRAQAERRFSVTDPDRLPEEGARELTASFQFRALPFGDQPIDRSRATPSRKLTPLYETAMKELEHTTHLSTADTEGMVVSLTTTLSAGFGARMMAERTGVILNNSVAAFGTAGKNLPAAGFRTISSMAPTIASKPDGTTFVLGSPGGDTIPSTVSWVFLALAYHAASLEEAVAAPRIHHGFVPDVIQYEPGAISPQIATELREFGHQLRQRRPFGDANNIVIRSVACPPGPVCRASVSAVADEREGGLALVRSGP